MKIVLATPLYPPEIGGPATYVANLAPALERAGHQVSIVRYGALKKLPTGLRHIAYACKLLPRALRTDAIIAFDAFSVGLPAAIVASITRKPLTVRVGGDFLWEQYVERTNDLIPLPFFYRDRAKWNSKEKFIFNVVGFVIRRARVVFPTHWLRDIWQEPYQLDLQRTSIIENAIDAPSVGSPAPAGKKAFLLYSRPIALKNHAAFRRAFEKAHAVHSGIELDEGMVSHEELMDRVRSCYAVVVPSISEVAPNAILEAISCGKPFILTKYSGYADRFKEYGVIVDPLDEDDMAGGIEKLADNEVYARLHENIASFDKLHSYDNIAHEFLELLQI